MYSRPSLELNLLGSLGAREELLAPVGVGARLALELAEAGVDDALDDGADVLWHALRVAGDEYLRSPLDKELEERPPLGQHLVLHVDLVRLIARERHAQAHAAALALLQLRPLVAEEEVRTLRAAAEEEPTAALTSVCICLLLLLLLKPFVDDAAEGCHARARSDADQGSRRVELKGARSDPHGHAHLRLLLLIECAEPVGAGALARLGHARAILDNGDEELDAAGGGQAARTAGDGEGARLDSRYEVEQGVERAYVGARVRKVVQDLDDGASRPMAVVVEVLQAVRVAQELDELLLLEEASIAARRQLAQHLEERQARHTVQVEVVADQVADGANVADLGRRRHVQLVRVVGLDADGLLEVGEEEGAQVLEGAHELVHTRRQVRGPQGEHVAGLVRHSSDTTTATAVELDEAHVLPVVGGCEALVAAESGVERTRFGRLSIIIISSIITGGFHLFVVVSLVQKLHRVFVQCRAGGGYCVVARVV